MTITAVAALYRVRIATRGATTVAGNVDLTLALADIHDVPTIAGPSVDVLRGTTTSHPFALECIVDTVLFTDSNRLAVIGRLIEIQRSEDAGGSWSTLATGRISGASEIDGKGKVTLRVADERWSERDTQIFQRTTTMQLHPPGLEAAFMDRPAAGTTIYEVVEVDGNAVKLRAANIGATALQLEVPTSLREALVGDMLASADRDNTATNSAGNFAELEFEWTETNGSPITASDNPVIGFRSTLGPGNLHSTNRFGLLGQMAPDGDGVLVAGWVYLGAGHGLIATDEITGRFYWPPSGNGIAVAENVPLHIGGVDGIHPMTLLRNALDGDYGGQAVLYDTTALTTLEGLSMGRVWVRATEPVDRARWLEKNVYPVYNVAPLVGTDLATRPTALRLPQDVDPTSLTTLDASSANNTDWDHTSRDLVNAIVFSSRALKPMSTTKDRGEDWPADRLEPLRQHVPDIDHDNTATLGRVAREIATELIISKSSVGFSVTDDVSRVLAQEIFDVFGDGPVRGTIPVADSSTVEVGDLVVLDQDTLKNFNQQTGDRTGDRIVRLIGFHEKTPASTRFMYLDLGPSSVVLSAPTVSVVQNGTDADIIDVTISGLSAGETAVVEATVDTTTPTEYEFRRSGVGNETVSFRVEASSGTAYARAYAFAPNRIRSAWAEDNVALSTRATISTADVSRLLTTAEVEWTVPADTLGMRTDYDIHDRNVAPTFGSNQTDYDAADGGFTISGFDGGTREMVSVQLTPYTGWTGSAVSGTAGDTITIEAVLRKIDGGIFLPRYSAPTAEVTFDENGNVVVGAQADEEAANIYVTVGDGSSPSDPTAGANDGSITGRSGTVDTGIKITTGNDAYVRVVAADADGNLGPVTEVRQARRLGPFHKDTTTRTQTGSTTEETLETITIPANTLGLNGGLRLEIHYEFRGAGDNHTLRVYLNSDQIFGLISTSELNVFAQLLLFNDGATNVQEAVGFQALSSGSVNLVEPTGLAEDSTADMDIVITGQVSAAPGPAIDLLLSHVTLLGTN